MCQAFLVGKSVGKGTAGEVHHEGTALNTKLSPLRAEVTRRREPGFFDTIEHYMNQLQDPPISRFFREKALKKNHLLV